VPFAQGRSGVIFTPAARYGVLPNIRTKLARTLAWVSISVASRLAVLRYQGGVSSYFEVLDAQRQLFDAELSLARARRDELTSMVLLYRALGGGWQLQEVAQASPAAAN